jgi:hypothetical protein
MIDTMLLARARAAAEAIAPLAGRIEADRRLPPPAVGVFKLLVPKIYGGAGARPPTFLDRRDLRAHEP